MKYSVVMRNNETDEVRTIPAWDLDWDGSIFWWTEGNAGCDCNRGHLWFGNYEERDCGSKRFTVIKAILENGDEVVIDSVL